MVTMLLGLVSPSTMEGGPSSSGLVKRLIGCSIIMMLIVMIIIIMIIIVRIFIIMIVIVTMIIIIWSNCPFDNYHNSDTNLESGQREELVQPGLSYINSSSPLLTPMALSEVFIIICIIMYIIIYIIIHTYHISYT